MFSCRLNTAVMCCFAMFMALLLRVDINLTLVCMVQGRNRDGVVEDAASVENNVTEAEFIDSNDSTTLELMKVPVIFNIISILQLLCFVILSSWVVATRMVAIFGVCCKSAIGMATAWPIK